MPNSTPTTDQIRTIIAAELDRRPIIHLHIQIPPTLSDDPEKIAAIISQAIRTFQPDPQELSPPDSPG
jgi:hypothetical protein